MCRKIGKKVLKLLLASVCIALLGTQSVFAKSKSGLVQEEEGFYYGYGKGSTKDEAQFLAKKDLIETALTASVRAANPRASRVTVSDDAVNARLTKISPYVQNKTGTDVTYRIKVLDWEKEEKIYGDTLRKSMADRFGSLSSNASTAVKIDNGISILNELSSNGVTELLTLTADGTELYSRNVEAVCSKLVENLSIELSVKDGFIGPDTTFAVTVKDDRGRAVPDLTLKIDWVVASLSVYGDEAELPEVVTVIKADSNGKAAVEYPSDSAFRNRPVSLTVSTAFSNSEFAYSALRKMDAMSSVDGCYVNYDDFTAEYNTVLVEAGEFNAGAVPQDTKAGSKEASHTVDLPAFEMSLTPVTNAEYAAYLYTTRSDSAPAYFDNADYNQANQPVVGISKEDAEAFAEWLSEQTGSKWRLPTEEEWEKAARAGAEVIYPWGDDSPAKAKNANYKGNGKYKLPSPVGSYPDGNNALGISDMSGNVWEWTSSENNVEEGSGYNTVKGGSWMDGPTELRISNSKNVDALNGYPDVGFRLVKEVEIEEE